MTYGPHNPGTPGDPRWQAQGPYQGQPQQGPSAPAWGGPDQAQARPAPPPAVWQAQSPGYPQAPGYPAQQTVMPKNPGVGLLLSFFVPGLGSMVNGNVGIGVAILITYVVGWVLTIVLVGFVIIFGAWVWGMVDGYKSAQRWNAAHGIIS